MNKFEFDSNLGKLNSSLTSQIFIEFELGSSSLKNLMSEPEHPKVSAGFDSLDHVHQGLGKLTSIKQCKIIFLLAPLNFHATLYALSVKSTFSIEDWV